MRICVFGLWHLGTVTAACLASVGHEVIGLDPDAKIVAMLRAGMAPVSEPGLDALLAAGAREGRLSFTSPKDMPDDLDVLWVTFDTPVDDDDRADTEFVIDQVRSVLPRLRPGTTVIVSSQLPVGSVGVLERFVVDQLSCKSIRFACSPENLRLGKAIDVFLNPDRVVVGVRDEVARGVVASVFAPVTDRIEWMSVESAEMTKHAINAFLATSVTFANEIANLCERVGADAKEVERGLKSESRIGRRAYLAPGAAFAGGTLARDVAFLGRLGERVRVTTPLIASVMTSNDEHRMWTMRKLEMLFPTLSSLGVAIWGLTYKPDTSTLRRSHSVELCDWLLSRGARVRVHDPMADALPERWSGRVIRCSSPTETLEATKALVIGTEWPQYREAAEALATGPGRGLTVLDATRFLPSLATVHDVRYVAVGTP